MMKRPFYKYAYLTSTWSVTAGWGTTTSLTLSIPKEGFYEVKAEGTAFANAANSDVDLRLNYGGGFGTGVPNSKRTIDMVTQNVRVPFSISTIVYLKAGENLFLEADENGGDVQIEQPTYIMIKELWE